MNNKSRIILLSFLTLFVLITVAVYTDFSMITAKNEKTVSLKKQMLEEQR